MAHLIPVLVGDLVAWVPPLNTSAVQEDIGLESLGNHCGHNLFDGLSVRQLGDMNIGFATKAVDDLILGGRIGFVSLYKH